MFHATLLQPYIKNEIYGNNYPRPLPELLEGEEVYEVETILKHRWRGRGYQYHVKWKGYLITKATWESESAFSDNGNMLQTYKDWFNSDTKRISFYWTIKIKEIWNKNLDIYTNKTRMTIDSSLKPPLPKWIAAFSNQSSSFTQMANNTETVAVKTEFVDVVTEGELLSSPISATFSTIVTDASLVEVPPTEGPINKESITTLYDKFSSMPFPIEHSQRIN